MTGQIGLEIELLVHRASVHGRPFLGGLRALYWTYNFATEETKTRITYPRIMKMPALKDLKGASSSIPATDGNCRKIILIAKKEFSINQNKLAQNITTNIPITEE